MLWIFHMCLFHVFYILQYAINSYYSEFIFVNLLTYKIYFQSQNQQPQCFYSHLQTCTVSWKTGIAWGTCSQLRLNKETLLSCFSSHAEYKCTAHEVLSAIFFFTFVCSSLVILLFRIAPVCSAAVHYSASKHKKAAVYLREKIYVLNKFRPQV